MNKKIISSLLALILLAGCDYNEKNFEGLEKGDHPTDVKKVEYTLADADYATIAANKTNIAIAKNAGEEVVAQLAAIKSKLHLSDVITAQTYFPAFLTEKWFTADAGSSVKVTYQKAVSAPAYLAEIEAAKSYKLIASDYEIAWEDQAVDYFTPSKPASTYLPRILKAAIPDAQQGEYATVEYNYSPTDPSTGGEVNPYNKIADAAQGAAGEYNVKGYVAAIYGKGFLLTDGKASILIYVNKLPNLSLGDVVAVKGVTSAYAGLMQFSATAQVSKLSVGESFSYPTFSNMTGTDMDAYVTAPAAKPITYTGTLSINGNFYDIKGIEGATKSTGSLSNPVNGTIDPELNGTVVTVTGYAIGVSSGRVNTIVVSVVAAGESAKTSSIGMVALAAPGVHRVRGTIVATYGRGFLVNDGTGSVLVYLNAPHTYAVGDVVTVSGATSKYSGLIQFPNTSAITKEGTVKVAYPDVAAMKATDMDAYVVAPCAQYATYKGMLVISADNKYYNVTIDGTTVQGSLSYPNEGAVAPELNGKEVIVTGYTIGVSGSTTKFVNTMVLSVVEAGAAPIASRLALARAAGGEKRYAVYQFDGSMWTAAANMAMVNPADYRQMGISNNYFSATVKPDNYLAQFMTLTYPYAQEGDTKASVYHYIDNSVISLSAEEYVFTKGAWTKNTNIVTMTDQFVYNGTQWNYDPSVVIRLRKGDAFAKEFLQVIVDWVKANKGEQLIDRNTAEYYFGCSAYYGNVELSLSYWRPYYVDKSDEELNVMIKQHIEKDGIFVPALKKYHADADVVDGIDVTYTVDFDVHLATGPGLYTIKYLVTGKGEFEYIKDSFKEVK